MNKYLRERKKSEIQEYSSSCDINELYMECVCVSVCFRVNSVEYFIKCQI